MDLGCKPRLSMSTASGRFNKRILPKMKCRLGSFTVFIVRIADAGKAQTQTRIDYSFQLCGFWSGSEDSGEEEEGDGNQINSHKNLAPGLMQLIKFQFKLPKLEEPGEIKFMLLSKSCRSLTLYGSWATQLNMPVVIALMNKRKWKAIAWRKGHFIARVLLIQRLDLVQTAQHFHLSVPFGPPYDALQNAMVLAGSNQGGSGFVQCFIFTQDSGPMPRLRQFLCSKRINCTAKVGQKSIRIGHGHHFDQIDNPFLTHGWSLTHFTLLNHNDRCSFWILLNDRIKTTGSVPCGQWNLA